MNIHEYLRDVNKVLRRKPDKHFITEPVEQPEKIVVINIDYNDLNKDDLTRMLGKRGIAHNKSQLKAELVALLEQDDKKNI